MLLSPDLSISEPVRESRPQRIESCLIACQGSSVLSRRSDIAHVFARRAMRILVSFLPILIALSVSAGPTRTSITFELQNDYTPRFNDDDLHDLTFDISNTSEAPTSTALTLQATPTTVYRPRSVPAYQHARLRSLQSQESEAVEWEQVRVLAPDVQDKHTLSQLARMTGNAYALPGRPNWYEIDPAWNTVRILPVLLVFQAFSSRDVSASARLSAVFANSQSNSVLVLLAIDAD